MGDFDRSPDGLAFSDAVRRAQTRLGSRGLHARAEWPIDISVELETFLAAQRSVVLATASADGQPYVQHRGGPAGFLRVLDSRTLGLVDLAGNREYVTLGNLSENDRVVLLAVDHSTRRRVKIWGRGTMVEDDPALVARLTVAGQRGRAERALLIAVEAWDVNCPQHIPRQVDATEAEAALARRDARIAELEDEVARLRARLDE